MGNKSSKIAAAQAKLDATEQKLVSASDTISARDRQLDGKGEELRAAKEQATEAVKEITVLRQQLQELGAQVATVDSERGRQIEKLKEDVAAKSSELVGQRRATDGVREERDGMRMNVVELTDRVKSLENEKEELLHISKQQRSQIEDASVEQTKRSEQSRTHLQTLDASIKSLEEKNKELSEELAVSKAVLQDETKKREEFESEAVTVKQQLQTAGSDLTTAKMRLAGTEDQLVVAKRQLTDSENHIILIRQQLTEAQRSNDDVSAVLSATQAGAVSAADNMDKELITTKNQLASTKEYLKEVERELATARQGLQQSEVKRETLQRGHNESISRKSAMHEAFEALKLELSESQEQYRKLQSEHQGLLGAAKANGPVSTISVAS